MKMLWIFVAVTLLLGNQPQPPAGRWRVTLELAGELNKAFAQQGLGDYLAVESFPVVMELELGEEGDYTLAADETAFARTVETLKEELTAGFTAYTRDRLTESGVELEVSEVFDAMGTSLTELLDRAFDRASLTDLALGEEKGRFVAWQGRLYFAPEGGEGFAKDRWEGYTLEGDTLTLTLGEGALHAAFSSEVYPLRFQRVA